MLFQNGKFILTITRLSKESESNKKYLKAKRKTANYKKSTYVYKFNTFEDFCNFSSYIYISSNINMLSPFLKSSRLHSFDNSYYLVLPNANIKFEKFKQIHYTIIEFANFIDNSELFERKLLEYGKLIFKTNAINNCVKHFC